MNTYEKYNFAFLYGSELPLIIAPFILAVLSFKT